MPGAPTPPPATRPVVLPADDQPLRIAWLIYRGNPHCGGQGVYTRYVAKEVEELGHEVTVFAGPPYPELVDPEKLVEVPSLDLYRPSHPFRLPFPHEIRDRIDVQELLMMCGAGFPEPYTFSLRVRKVLQQRRGDFDLVHDNQCLGRGLVPMMQEDGWPVMATLHHPITVDRDLDFAHTTSRFRKLTLRRWYGFLGMQMEVARQIPRLVTVSESSKRDITAQMGVDADRLHIVPVGVDPTIFRPKPEIARVPGRLMTTASADVPMKGLAPLLESLAKVRTERPDAHLVVIGRPKERSKIPALIDTLGLTDAVEFVSGVTTERIVELYAEAEVACVPSLYEGFSLPAVEAMACGVPVVATTGGAVPEVVGRDEETGLLVPPGDPSALAAAILRALGDADLRARIGAAGRERALANFTWRQTALGTVEQWRILLEDRARATHDAGVR
ncbi:MAG: glycosyltransferase family 4 protein [Actinobacteria bacterium]|nr:glycosyltransferase family 4 protein [Actinomycetota bacterium]